VDRQTLTPGQLVGVDLKPPQCTALTTASSTSIHQFSVTPSGACQCHCYNDAGQSVNHSTLMDRRQQNTDLQSEFKFFDLRKVWPHLNEDVSDETYTTTIYLRQVRSAPGRVETYKLERIARVDELLYWQPVKVSRHRSDVFPWPVHSGPTVVSTAGRQSNCRTGSYNSPGFKDQKYIYTYIHIRNL